MSNALVADQKIANAPLVLENTAGNTGFWALKSYQPFAAQPRTFHNFDQEAAASEHFDQNFANPVQRVDERLMELQESYAHKLNTIGSVESMEFSKAQKKQDDTVPRMQLPPHTHATNISFSQTRGDLVSLMGINLERICAALGISRTLFNGQSGLQGEGSLRMVQRQFDEVTRIYRPFINSLLTDAVRLCTEADDFLMGFVSGSDHFQTKPTLELLVPGVQTSELIELYSKGLVDREYVRKQIEVDYGLCLTVESAEKEPEAESDHAPEEAQDTKAEK